MRRADLAARLGVNLSTLFCELPFLARFAAARDAGFENVEFQFPYEFDLGDIKQAIDDAGVKLVMHNFPAGDWKAGERGLACDPGSTDRFAISVDQGLHYASGLEVSRVNCLGGIRPENYSDGLVRETLTKNLAEAAQALARSKKTLLVEAINDIDVPGFALPRASSVLDLLAGIDAENAKLQFDLYHAHRMGEDIIGIIEARCSMIGHVQFADAPGRHEPGTGDIDFLRIFDCLAANGYQGYLSAEYFPTAATETGLFWRQQLFGL